MLMFSIAGKNNVSIRIPLSDIFAATAIFFSNKKIFLPYLHSKDQSTNDCA